MHKTTPQTHHAVYLQDLIKNRIELTFKHLLRGKHRDFSQLHVAIFNLIDNIMYKKSHCV